MRKNLAIRIGSTTFPLSELTERDVYVTRDTPIYRDTPDKLNAKPVFIVKKGGLVGKMYSWTRSAKGNLIFMFDDALGKPYFMLYDNNVDFTIMGEQGARTYEEVEKDKKKKEAENNSMLPGVDLPDFSNMFEGFGDGIQGAIKTGVLVVAGGLALWLVTRK